MRATLLTAASIALLAGCGQNTVDHNPAGNVGSACSQDTDCVTPMSYLIRSNCPFTSICHEGTCAVACPIITDPEPGDLGGDACEADSECDCSERMSGSGAVACTCHEGECFAVVK